MWRSKCSFEFLCNGYQCTLVAEALGNTGDSCGSSINCVGGNACINSVCQGVPIGGVCVPMASNCVFGAYCNSTSMCSAYLPIGGNCATGAQCDPYSAICGFGGLCVTSFSIPLGGNCVIASECQPGLSCNQEKCAIEIPITPCNQPSDCLNAGLDNCNCNADGTKTCSGSGIASVSIPTQCATYNQQLLTCATQNKCASTLIGPNSCIQRNCAKFTNCALGCAFNTNAIATKLPVSCFVNPYPCSTGVSITFGWILFVLLLFAFLI